MKYKAAATMHTLPSAVGGRSWHLAVLLAACLLLAAWLLLTAGAASALAKPAKPFRIGDLSVAWGPGAHIVGLRDGLVALGYRENHDFVIGTRFTGGVISTLPAAVRDLLNFGVDVIVTNDDNSALTAKQTTSSIPIIFLNVDNPVEAGLVQSYAKPGGNLTGVADGNTLLAPKRLEMFKLMIPGLRKVFYVYDGGDLGSARQVKAYRGAARRLGVELVARAVRTEGEAEAALEGLGKGDVDGILAPANITLNIPGLLMQTASRKKIPAMFVGAFWLEQGALASYAPSYFASGRQAARLVAKIMRGVKPADIPVEVNNDIEFAVNLKVAKALGLKIDPQVLYRADRIVR